MRRSALPSEPVRALRRVPIAECGEPLVNFLGACSGLLLDRPRYDYRRETLLRGSVAAMLCRADAALRPRGYRLAVIEGWRAPHIQRRMFLATLDGLRLQHPEWPEARLLRVAARYSAPPDEPDCPPPHVTGGAVDVMLALPDGAVCDHHSPLDPWDTASYALDCPGLSAEARETRRRLADALSAAGLTNYPGEYWHWSYGDQGWAYRGGHPHALYGATVPADYVPSPGEDIDAPLAPL